MCIHSGTPNIPSSQCAACNGVRAEKPEFKGRRVEEEPRLRKGRDSAQWIGLGESVTHEHKSLDLDIKDAALACTRMGDIRIPKTAWGVEQAERSFQDYLNRVRRPYGR